MSSSGLGFFKRDRDVKKLCTCTDRVIIGVYLYTYIYTHIYVGAM